MKNAVAKTWTLPAARDSRVYSSAARVPAPGAPYWSDQLSNLISVAQGQPFSVTFEAVDDEGDAIPFSYSNVPAGVTVAEGVQSGDVRTITLSSAGLAADSYSLVISLNGGATRTFAVNVEAVSGSVFVPVAGYSAPAAGTPGSTFTLNKTGGGFGTGPNVRIYANWRSPAAVGQPVQATHNVVGTWGQVYGGTGPAPVYTIGRDGGLAVSAVNTDLYSVGYNACNFHLDDIPPFTEIFWACDVYTGPYFGTTTAGRIGQWNLKWFELYHDASATDFTSNERIFNWNAVNTRFDGVRYGTAVTTAADSNAAAGISGGNARLSGDILEPEWDFAGWNHVEHWVKLDPDNLTATTPETSDHKIWWTYSGSNKSFGSTTPTEPSVFGLPMMNSLNSRPLYYGYISTPNFLSNYYDLSGVPIADWNLDIRMDDLYIATGPNAAKRFVIADTATLGSARETYICYSPIWGDGSVTISIPYMQVGSSLVGKYLHYLSADNAPTLVGQFT